MNANPNRAPRYALYLTVAGLLIAVMAAGAVATLWQGEKKQRKRDLATLALYDHTFIGRNGVGPRDLDDFRNGLSAPLIYDQARAAAAQSQLDSILLKVKEGDVVLVRRGDFAGTSAEELRQYVLAYERQVPESGGWVARGDGLVVEMTPAQFASLRKLPIAAEKPSHP